MPRTRSQRLLSEEALTSSRGELTRTIKRGDRSRSRSRSVVTRGRASQSTIREIARESLHAEISSPERALVRVDKRTSLIPTSLSSGSATSSSGSTVVSATPQSPLSIGERVEALTVSPKVVAYEEYLREKTERLRLERCLCKTKAELKSARMANDQSGPDCSPHVDVSGTFQ